VIEGAKHTTWYSHADEGKGRCLWPE
jgi:hypothetical protein